MLVENVGSSSVTWIELIVGIAAIWGAVLSTVVFVRQYQKDKPYLYIRIYKEFVDNKLNVLTVEVVNNGQNPLPISFVGFVLKNFLGKKTFFLAQRSNHPSISLTLNPGQSNDYRFGARKLADELAAEGYSRTVRLRAYALTPDRKRFESAPIKFSMEDVTADD